MYIEHSNWNIILDYLFIVLEIFTNNYKHNILNLTNSQCIKNICKIILFYVSKYMF